MNLGIYWNSIKCSHLSNNLLFCFFLKQEYTFLPIYCLYNHSNFISMIPIKVVRLQNCLKNCKIGMINLTFCLDNKIINSTIQKVNLKLSFNNIIQDNVINTFRMKNRVYGYKLLFNISILIIIFIGAFSFACLQLWVELVLFLIVIILLYSLDLILLAKRIIFYKRVELKSNKVGGNRVP